MRSILAVIYASRFNTSLTRFLIAGGLAFLVDFGLLALLHQLLGLPLWLSTGVAFLVSFFVAYFLQRIFAFSSTAPHGGALIRYTALVAFNAGATIAVVSLLNSTPLSWEGGKVVATAITTMWNFFLYRSWVFRRARPITPSD